jgi:hypothetical protein
MKTLEEYNDFIRKIESDSEEGEFASALLYPSTYPSARSFINRQIVNSYEQIISIIHKDSYSKEDILAFLISCIRLIGGSNGQTIPEKPVMGFLDITNEGGCYYIGNEPDRERNGCKLEKINVRLQTYVEFLKDTFLLFFSQLNKKNPELIPFVKSMDCIEILHKSIQFLIYFAASKFVGDINSVFGFEAFYIELQKLIPDTIEILCTTHDYGWGRYVFYKSCNNKRDQGKIYSGCTTGIERTSINAASSNMERSKGPMCGAVGAANANGAAAGNGKAAPASGGAGYSGGRRKTRRVRRHRRRKTRR